MSVNSTLRKSLGEVIMIYFMVMVIVVIMVMVVVMKNWSIIGLCYNFKREMGWLMFLSSNLDRHNHIVDDRHILPVQTDRGGKRVSSIEEIVFEMIVLI